MQNSLLYIFSLLHQKILKFKTITNLKARHASPIGGFSTENPEIVLQLFVLNVNYYMQFYFGAPRENIYLKNNEKKVIPAIASSSNNISKVTWVSHFSTNHLHARKTVMGNKVKFLVNFSW